MSYEDDAFEIARRVLKSYRSDGEPEDGQVSDLGQRIHKAAADIANEKVKEEPADKPDPFIFSYFPTGG